MLARELSPPTALPSRTLVMTAALHKCRPQLNRSHCGHGGSGLAQWGPFLETAKNMTNVEQGFMVIREADQALVHS